MKTSQMIATPRVVRNGAVAFTVVAALGIAPILTARNIGGDQAFAHPGNGNGDGGGDGNGNGNAGGNGNGKRPLRGVRRSADGLCASDRRNVGPFVPEGALASNLIRIELARP